jgi:predicted nucleotidyltransferase
LSFDPRPFAAGLQRLNALELERIRARARLALEEAQRLAVSIQKSDGSVHSIFLFGSLATGGPRRLDFDIDIALEGGDIYRALDIVAESPFRVDLVDLSLVPEELAARIRETGLRLV